MPLDRSRIYLLFEWKFLFLVFVNIFIYWPARILHNLSSVVKMIKLANLLLLVAISLIAVTAYEVIRRGKRQHMFNVFTTFHRNTMKILTMSMWSNSLWTCRQRREASLRSKMTHRCKQPRCRQLKYKNPWASWSKVTHPLNIFVLCENAKIDKR